MAEEMKPEEKEIQQAIEFYRRQGYADGQIMTILKNKGYGEEVVEQILTQPKAEFKGTAIKAGGRRLDIKGILPAFLLFLIIAGAILVVWAVFFGGPTIDVYAQQLTEALVNLGVKTS